MRNELKLNKKTESQLKNYLTYHRGNAVLLGERHMGKYLAAIELAKILLCPQAEAGGCKNCANCSVSLGQSMDFMEIKPENGVIKAEQIRQAITYFRYKRILAPKKVIVIDDADTMTAAAQNALLKIMEDDTEDGIFLFVAHQPLLKTVSSRSMIIRFLPLDAEEGADPVLHLLSEGKPGMMERYQESEFLAFIHSFLYRLSHMNDRRTVLEELGELKEKDQNAFLARFSEEEAESFLSMMENLFRNALYLCLGISCMEGISGTAAHIQKLYGADEICAILKEAAYQKQLLRKQKCCKNDFFRFVMMLGGGNSHVV